MSIVWTAQKEQDTFALNVSITSLMRDTFRH